MNYKTDRAFGRSVRTRREALGLSQTALSKKLKWPQAKLSRVEQGKRSVTLPELLTYAQVFECSVNDLLGVPGSASVVAEGPLLSSAFSSAWENEAVLLAQLARHGVRFMGGTSAPSLVSLPLDETVLAGLRYMRDPRLFEALPALLVKNARQVDWTKLTSAAYSLGLQNRLGGVVASALRLGADERVQELLRSAHETLAERKLDREEVVGSRPKTQAAVELLRRRTPPWLRFWHVLASGDLDSSRRYLR